MRILLAFLLVCSGVLSLRAAEPPNSSTNALATNAIPRRVAFTNLVAGLPVQDRVWLMGEQLKQLVGDWVNQQGDVGLDLLYFLQEPTKILSDEVKRMEQDHQKQIAELRAEIAALKAQLQPATRTNLAVPARGGPAPPPAEARPQTRSGN